MPDRSLVDRLDVVITDLLAARGTRPRSGDADLRAFIEVAEALRDLPRVSFRARLKSELERTSAMTMIASEPAAAVLQTATPHLRVRNAAAAIDFYVRAFGANEVMRFEARGQVAHAELAIGNSIITLGEEAAEYGYPGPEQLGGSPVSIRLFVEDADASIARAVAAGARLVTPATDEFYGVRSGHVTDPFGYQWTLATRKEHVPLGEMHRRFEEMMAEQGRPTAATFVREGFRAVTPYLIVQDAPGLIDFVTRVFGAGLTFRTVGSAGGVHAELRVDDSMLMVGGGAPELSWRGESRPAGLHLYVTDVDAVFRRSVDAGAAILQPPVDQAYGERGGSVKDPFGNIWHIATSRGAHHVPEGQHTINPCLHPLRAQPVLDFLRRGFGGEAIEKFATPDGVIHHARIAVGDSVIEMGEAHGPYQPMPSTFYVYVENVDAAHRRAVEAGASSLSEPADQAYGDRTAAVVDPFGHTWYLATHFGERVR